MSTPLNKTQAWAEVYERRRVEGHKGWGSTKQYEDKKARLESAIQRYAFPLGAQWLELGCGAGNMTTWLVEHGYRGIGIDVVPEAIAWAKAKNNEAQFYVGDITCMSMFGDGQFDVVYDADCLQMVLAGNCQLALGEIRRVLKSGGLFLCGINVARAGLAGVFHHAKGNVFYNPADRTVYVEGRREYHLADAESFREELHSAGFQVVQEVLLPPRGRPEYMESWLEVDAK